MGYQVQSDDGQNKVKVNAGIFKKTGQPQTDVIITEAGFPGEHTHMVFDERGELAYRGINPNTPPPGN
jgi:hypothetical protein